MKKILFTIVIAMAMQAGHACDICGMGVSNSNPFLFPHLHKRYFGINYLYRSYQITTDDGITSTERYNTWLMAAQFTIGKRIQIYASLPMQANSEEDYFGKQSINGLGDATFSINYKLFDRTAGINRHTILIGGGIKLPTGQNTAVRSTELDEQNFQLGTGSIDYIITGSYTFSHKAWTFGTTASYKYNTPNDAGFRFGDIITTSIVAAYTHTADKFSLSPYVQLRNEVQMVNADDHVLQTHTGGNALYAAIGSDVNFRKISLGVAYQVAPIQHLAEDQVKVNPSFSTRISFTF
jgi:hypothetical protein